MPENQIQYYCIGCPYNPNNQKTPTSEIPKELSTPDFGKPPNHKFPKFTSGTPDWQGPEID